MHLPSKETILGLYLMTNPVGTPVKKASATEMLTEFQAGKLEVNAAVLIGGKTWTPGQALVDALFPEDMKPGNTVLDKKKMESLLYTTARKYPKKIGDIVTRIKDLGNHYVTHVGFSLSLGDLTVDRKQRDRIMAEAAKKVKKSGFDVAYAEASEKVNETVRSNKDSRAVIGSITSGAFGKAEGVVQMLGAPVAVTDQKGRTIPIPIGRSYVEGLDIGSYWATLPGARRGMVQKGLGTQEIGALSKRLLNTTVSTVVSEHDCGTHRGLTMAVDSRDALDRVIADGTYRGRIVTPDLVRDLKGRGVMTLIVRSPLTCESVRGICAGCYGTLESGQLPSVGYNVGVLAGHAVSEPATQLMLKQFHTQGVMGQKTIGFDRIEQLLEMPDNVQGSATLAKTTGKVTDIRPSAAGGWFVDIGAAEHYIPKERGLSVKKGEAVRAGQRLSTTGVIKPQELLGATGDIHKVRDQLINDLNEEFRAGGVQVKRKLFETIIKPMTDRAEVTDAGDGEEHGIFRGEIVSVNHMDSLNKEIKKAKGRPIRYTPTLLPVGMAPFHGDDFIGKLMFERPHETLIAAPAIGAVADIKAGHPITQYTFGKYVVGGKRG
jgi:DNA-directed RNA polymerase subunit beta'